MKYTQAFLHLTQLILSPKYLLFTYFSVFRSPCRTTTQKFLQKEIAVIEKIFSWDFRNLSLTSLMFHPQCSVVHHNPFFSWLYIVLIPWEIKVLNSLIFYWTPELFWVKYDRCPNARAREVVLLVQAWNISIKNQRPQF